MNLSPPEKPCSTCNSDDYIVLDPFGMGGSLLDFHMDILASEEEVIKRFVDAVESAQMFGGTVPQGLLEELGLLVAPVVRWEDIVSGWAVKTKSGRGRNDWSAPQSRPPFAGLYTPRKKRIDVRILFLYDCSGSMGQDDIGLVVSQLGAIGKRECDVYCLPFDTKPYYEQMVKLNKFDKEHLATIKPMGRGGTLINEALNTYEQHIGPMDIVLIGTDGFLADQELKDVRPSSRTKYMWLLSANNPGFKPTFGSVKQLVG